jgi:hypothetical protein
MSPEAFMAATPRGLESNTDWGARYARTLRNVIVRQATLAPRSQQVHLGPSELGEACDRQVVAKLAGAPRTNNVSDPWPSVVGTSVHAWLAEACRDDNSRDQVLRWITEQAVEPAFGYAGHADLYDSVEKCVCDWKILGATSLNKIKSPKGPPRRYQMQLLLYARGYRNLGLPVERVAIAALPRTAATLDSMFVWDHVCTPEDDILVDEVLRRTEIRQWLGTEVKEGRMQLNQVPATPDGDTCFFCLGPETKVVTRRGIRSIAELAGTSPELLIPKLSSDGRRMRVGSFRKAPVSYFGEQPTYRVVLEDRQARKEVIATAEHNWFVTDRTRIARGGARVTRHQWQKITTALQPGDLLQPLRRATAQEPDRMDVAVAQGFTFGDGTVGQGQRPATLAVYDNGKDDVMLSFFPAFKQYDGVKHIYGLPRFWKTLPPLDESRPFLLSWLAGYFAADGNISAEGGCAITSADRGNLLFVRDLAAVCGIGYRPVQETSRVGIGATVATDLFKIGLQRRDLPSWFFLLDKHRQYAEAANEKPERESYWKVVSIEPTGRIEPVYCATVNGIGAFGLADDLMTGNCFQYRPQAAYDGGPGCPGMVTRRG